MREAGLPDTALINSYNSFWLALLAKRSFFLLLKKAFFYLSVSPARKDFFRKPTFNSLCDPFGSPYRGQKPSLPLRKAPPLTPTLSPSGEREETALLGARNRFALRLADHQRSRQIVRDGTAWVLLACDLLMDLLLLACGLLMGLLLLACGLLMGLLLLACGLLRDLGTAWG